MQFSLESLASLATIAGLLITVLGIFQSREWLALTSLSFAAVAVSLFAYARHMKNAVSSASIVIEGHSVDALNIANLRRRTNRTFFIQEAEHAVRIEGEDMEITWRYSGYCCAKSAAEMEFTINSEAGTRFNELDSVAYDLGRDPEKTHPIRPRLVGADGISKRISVPLLETLKEKQPFEIVLTFKLPRCARKGFSYYVSALSFAQNSIHSSVVHLVFSGAAPSWVRVYECIEGSGAVLLKNLAPESREAERVEYFDAIKDRPGQSARVYSFWRDF
jgi:hypothetical protein